MADCPYCHEQLRGQYDKPPSYRFCPYCGWQLDIDARRVDFELGRIEALHTIREDIAGFYLKRLPIFIVIIAALGLLGFNGWINYKVVNTVAEQLERIQSGLKKMVEIFPIIENDFYRIKKVDVLMFIVDIEGNPSPSMSDYAELSDFLMPKNSHRIDLKLKKYDNSSILYNYELIDESDKIIDTNGQPIEILSKYYLKLDPVIGISSKEPIESKDRTLDIIKGINFILKINDIVFYKAFVSKGEFKINSATDEHNPDPSSFIIKIPLGKYFKNAEEVRKIYREKLSIQRDL